MKQVQHQLNVGLDGKRLVQLAYIYQDGDYTVDLTEITEITVIVAYNGLGANCATVPMETFKLLPLNPNSLNNGALIQYVNDNTIRCGGLTTATVMYVYGRK